MVEKGKYDKQVKELQELVKKEKELELGKAEAVEKDKEKEEIGKKKEQKPEKVTRPWEEKSEKEEVRLYEKFTKKFELEKGRKDDITALLQTETDDRRIEFTIKWFENHKEELEKEGISPDIELSRDRMAEIAIEKGAFEDLKKDKRYKEDWRNIENMYAMRKDFEKGVKCPIESQFAILNTLDKRAEKIEKELEEMEKTEKPDIEINEKRKELDDLFKDRKELTVKIRGVKLEDLDKEAEAKIGLLEQKDSYIERLLEERKQREEIFEKSKLLLGHEIKPERWEIMENWEKDRVKKEINTKMDEIKNELKRLYPKRMITEDEKKILALMNAGYNVKEFKLKGPLGGAIELRKTDGTKEKKDYKDFLNFVDEKVKEFDSEIETKTKEGLEGEWNNMKIEHDNGIREEIEKEIKTIVESPEKAARGIEALFDRIKGRLIDEYLKEGVKKEKKTAEEIEKIKEYEKKGMIEDTPRFISEGVERKKGLDKISGDIEEDPGIFADYFKKSHNIEVAGEDIRNFIENREKEGKNLQEIVKSEKGFLDYLIELVLYLLGLKEEGKSEKEK